MGNLEHEIKHVPMRNRRKASGLILPLAALLTYAGCADLPKPTRFDDEPKTEYVALSQAAPDSGLYLPSHAIQPGYGGDSGTFLTPAVIDQLRAVYNTLPEAASVPFDQAYRMAELRHQRAAKPAGVADISLESMVVQDESGAARPLADDLGWMPYLKRDFNGSRGVDFDDFFLFIDRFGSRRGDSRYDPAFDLNGSGAIDLDDFFGFADGFGVTQTGIDIRASPTITGQLEVAIPTTPGLTYAIGNNVITAGGDSLVVNADVPPELYGQPIRLEVTGYNIEKEPIRGGEWRGDMPNYYFNGPLNGGRADFVLPNSLPPNVWLYVLGSNPEMTYKGLVNDMIGRAGGGIADKFNIIRRARPGSNYFSLREEPVGGNVLGIVVSDSDKLVYSR